MIRKLPPGLINLAKNKIKLFTLKKGTKIISRRIFDTKDKMMYENGWNWSQKVNGRNIGAGDALWRTGLAYITWSDPEMKEGILKCFRKINEEDSYYYQGMRASFGHGEEDVSRDQIEMALVSLKFNGDYKGLKEIASHLKYKLSEKFNMTPDYYCWVKSLSNTKYPKFWSNLFFISQLLTFPFIVIINKIIDKLLKFKSQPNNEYSSLYTKELTKNWGKEEKILDGMYFPGYAQHLLSWQIYSSPVSKNNILRKLLSKWALFLVEKENYLLRMLLGDKTVTKEEIDSYEPREGFRWEMVLNGSSSRYYGEENEEWRKKWLKYNQMDKDILIKIYLTEKTQ